MWARLLVAIVFAVVLVLPIYGSAQADEVKIDAPVFLKDDTRSRSADAQINALRQKLSDEGTITVIAGLSTPIDAPEKVGDAKAATQERAFGRATDALYRRVFASAVGKDARDAVFEPFESIPFVTMTIDQRQFERLLGDPVVETIQLDSPLEVKTRLREMVDIVNADYLGRPSRADGGRGQTVAILDSGLDRNVPSLKGRIVHEACISARRGCVGRKKTLIGPGSGWQCRGTAAEWARKNRERDKPRYCFDHGTQVASVVAARNARPRGHPPFLRGMAPNIKIMFVRLPTVSTTRSSAARAIEHVFNKRRQFGVDAVTMSLGFGREIVECTDTTPVIEAAIGKLTDAGIPFFNAAGNDSSSRSIDYPGCLPNVVSVGASTESDKKIADFSDTNHLVELLSPANKYRPTSTNKYATSGTSFASPAAAAGFAMLKKANSGKTTEEILRAMRCSGKQLTREGDRYAIPRIDLEAAHKLLQSANPKLRWQFRKASEELGWVSMIKEAEVTEGRLVIDAKGVPGFENMTFLLNDICFDAFEIEARMRLRATNPGLEDVVGLVLVEEPKKDRFGPRRRSFNFYKFDEEYVSNPFGDPFGFTRLRRYRDFQWVDDTYQVGSAPIVYCSDTDTVNITQYNVYKLRYQNGQITTFINGQQQCSVTIPTATFQSVGIVTSVSERTTAANVDYIVMTGL